MVLPVPGPASGYPLYCGENFLLFLTERSCGVKAIHAGNTELPWSVEAGHAGFGACEAAAPSERPIARTNLPRFFQS